MSDPEAEPVRLLSLIHIFIIKQFLQVLDLIALLHGNDLIEMIRGDLIKHILAKVQLRILLILQGVQKLSDLSCV